MKNSEKQQNNKFDDSDSIIEIGKRVLQIEKDAIGALENRLDNQFEQAVSLIFQCRGRVVVSGVGKSGVIGRKIAATLSSTGTPAVFMHASDGMHGDLGVMRSDDVVIWISKSGNSEEFKGMLPLLKHINVPIIAITGNLESNLVRNSKLVLDVSVTEEACPNDIAPTASTTATLAIGDALAVAVLKKRKFTPEDFAYLHPGGSLGKQLLLKVDDIMSTGEDMPVVSENAGFREIILEMNSKRFGGTCVLDKEGRLAGIITDGDLKRLLEKDHDLGSLTAGSVMTRNPKVVETGELAAKALHILKQYNIMQIVVVDKSSIPLGMIHLHNLLDVGFY